jgi:hypothetical protein
VLGAKALDGWAGKRGWIRIIERLLQVSRASC